MQTGLISCTSTELSGQESLLFQWDQQYQQMSSGRFRGELAQLDLGEVRLARERMNVAVDQQATPPANWIAVSIPINGCKLLQCNSSSGITGTSGPQLVMTELGRYRAISDCNSDIMVIMVHRNLFESTLERFRLSDRDLMRLSIDISDGVATELSQMLNTQQGCVRTETETARMARYVVDQLANCPIIRPSDVEKSRQWRLDRQKIVRQACEAAETQGLDCADLAMMCEAAGVSLRLIQASFREVLDMSPGRWLRMQRLNAARRQILHDAEKSITKIAMDLNFFHLGRFAQEYRQLFHEAPSQTRRRA